MHAGVLGPEKCALKEVGVYAQAAVAEVSGETLFFVTVNRFWRARFALRAKFFRKELSLGSVAWALPWALRRARLALRVSFLNALGSVVWALRRALPGRSATR